MKTYVFAAPIIEGKLEVFKSLVAQINGDRQAESIEFRKLVGLDREQVYLQQTPMGDFAVLVWDTEDYKSVFKQFATLDTPYAEWFRAQLLEIHGFTTEQLAQGVDVLPLGEWTADSWSYGADTGWVITYPIKDVELAKSFVGEIFGAKNAEYVATRSEQGLTRQLFGYFTTPQGPVFYMYGEGSPNWWTKAFELQSKGDASLYTWWRDQVASFAAVNPLAGAMPSIELYGDIKAKTPVGIA